MVRIKGAVHFVEGFLDLGKVARPAIDVEELSVCPWTSTAHRKLRYETFNFHKDWLRILALTRFSKLAVKVCRRHIKYSHLFLLKVCFSRSTENARLRSTMLSNALGPQSAVTDARVDGVPEVRICTDFCLEEAVKGRK